MAAATKDVPRTYSVQPAEFNGYGVKAAEIIYGGTAVMADATGTPDAAEPLSGSGVVFLGFADRKADNAGGVVHDIKVTVRSRGSIEIPITGLTGDTLMGGTVYATDDQTFKLTSTGGTAIGKLIQFITGTTGLVAFESTPRSSV